jgi:hypothetical protein
MERIESVDRIPRARAEEGAPQNDDIVACRRSDGRFELRQLVDDEFVMIRVRAYDRPQAEAAALELSRREQSDAWIQEGAGVYRRLDIWVAASMRPKARRPRIRPS